MRPASAVLLWSTLLVPLATGKSILKTCTDCTLSGTVLSCKCLNLQTTFRDARIDLNKHMGNFHDMLSWNSYVTCRV
ncbi:hypothetical protein CC86DRAFT_366324 [Ophiobolus disseminans]|uniref:Cyanovirin-N domain-containing protein n=1 Tax=Ophiobolus disseminans TaxID=1469910 RepID=A0A6A7AH77_9PLEO|nr:hypothetical protein CC86DRAFT_366324 [Ophiobolus disseminans]